MKQKPTENGNKDQSEPSSLTGNSNGNNNLNHQNLISQQMNPVGIYTPVPPGYIVPHGYPYYPTPW